MNTEPSTPQTYHLTAPNSPLSPRVCRDTVAILLTANGHAPHLSDTARTLVSEVVTNAVLHTTTPTIRLTTAVAAGAVRVSVYDDDPADPPSPSMPPHDSDSGRGLLLVQAMAHAWGVGPAHPLRRNGKHVWFELRDHPAQG
jgi:anti-sigma regulatory factor (Ser/Thr protein kinase)